MKIGQYFSEAIRSLLGSKLRSGLTILGIVIGVASVIAMLAVGRGAQDSINTSISSIGTNLLFITAGAQTTPGSSQNFTPAQPLTLADAQALIDPLNAPDVLAVAPILQARTSVSYSGTSINTAIIGTTPAYQGIESLKLTDGNFFTDVQSTQRSSVAVLGSTAATNIFGDATNIVGSTIIVQGVPFTVIGVLASKGGSALG